MVKHWEDEDVFMEHLIFSDELIIIFIDATFFNDKLDINIYQ